MRLCFDLDGTLCTNTYGDYENAEPIISAIKKVNKLYDEGHYIMIFTARYMGKFQGDVKKVYDFGYETTKKQLEKWNIQYHELLLGKPEFDIVIDDKNHNFDNDWPNKI
tara:strand:+ start:105 stop:431 length:327 start_codon:yes stop_codon:yes gene_type:complete